VIAMVILNVFHINNQAVFYKLYPNWPGPMCIRMAIMPQKQYLCMAVSFLPRPNSTIYGVNILPIKLWIHTTIVLSVVTYGY